MTPAGEFLRILRRHQVTCRDVDKLLDDLLAAAAMFVPGDNPLTTAIRREELSRP